MGDAHQIIMGQIITEKTTDLRANSVYVFRVRKDATKGQIVNAIRTVFNVTPESVNTTKVRGKTRQLGRSFGVTSGWKKAYVKLKSGEKIKELEVGA